MTIKELMEKRAKVWEGAKAFVETHAGNGMAGFAAKERVDGKLVLPEAVQILKLSA